MKQFACFLLCLTLSAPLFSQPLLLKDINPGANSSYFYPDNAMVRFGDYIYFAAKNAASGAELWRTDGTVAGTEMVKEINPGFSDSRLNNFYVVGSFLLFTADDGVSGLELWRTDGTSAGTVLVKDINPGANDAIGEFIDNPAYYAVFNGKLYFGANNGVNGNELWSSDGTESGTKLVRDIDTGSFNSYPNEFEVHNGVLYFAARAAQGEELWKTDGTTAGTVLVKDIYPGGFGSSPANLRSIGSTLIFTADDDVHDEELWKTDGTAAGTVLVKDIKTNSVGTFSTSSFATQPNSFENRFIRLGDIALFSAIDDSNGIELWKTDGTTAGTVMVKNASPAAGSDGYAPQNFAVLGNSVFYKYDNDTTGIELWKSDGTASGTGLVKDVYSGFFGSFYLPSYLYAHVGKLYFGAESTPNGIELMESDGTANGTKLVANIYAGSGSSTPGPFISLEKKLIFWATNETVGTELWSLAIPISVSAVTTPATCFGDSTGSISLAVGAEGTAPFTAVWEPSWVSGLEPANLPAGTYKVTVTDAEGAVGTLTVNVGQPTALSATTASTPEAGTAANGTATANAAGGTAPYSYLWSTIPPQTTQTAINLSAGNYTCTVTDAKGCTLTATATVSQVTSTGEKTNGTIQMTVRPNPANDLVFWSVAGETAVSGSVFQSNGQLVRTFDADELVQGQLNTNQFPEGVYYLRVVLKTGKVAHARLVVAR
jgi:ELWxxDGT repeat protein